MAWICRAVLLFAVAVVICLAFDILDVQSGLQNRFNRNSYSINSSFDAIAFLRSAGVTIE